MRVGKTKEDAESGSPPCDDDPSQKDLVAESGRRRRKRQSQSCDACRARKVRCVRENPDDPKRSCKHCIVLAIPCTYDYQPKKRGPPNLYLRRLQEAAATAAQNSNTPDTHESIGHDPISPVPSHRSSATPTQASVSPLPSTARSCYLQSAVSIMSPFRYPVAADAFQYSSVNVSPCTSFSGARESAAANAVLLPSAGDTRQHASSEPYGSFSPYSWSYKYHQPLPVLPPTAIPPLSYHYRPYRLQDVAHTDTISLIITLFFDFVFPLTPCVHKSSFMADLHSHREERDPLFFALVMSTVASTLVQVPSSYLPMDRAVVRKLAQTCYEASRHITVVSYDPPTSMQVVIRYFDSIYHFCEAHEATQYAAFGEAVHIAIVLRMHEEISYEGLDPIECEVRRRIFWLLFGADKSMSILVGRPICLRDEDCTVHFPKEIDDEYITPTAYLPQPHGKTAVVSGLNYISRIFALLGEILVRIRVDKRSPPKGHFATARLEEVQSLHLRILGVLMHAPEPLRLKQPHQNDHLPAENDGAEFREATFAEVRDFFDNPKASRANALNPFLVMQANLYVTQQLVRFVIEQYRDELVVSLHGSIDERQVSEDRESVASDLLNILHSIPIQSIATNGPSLIHKVRFVASSLLDTVCQAEAAPASAARAHAFLCGCFIAALTRSSSLADPGDFLSILSEIERNYLLDDDRDGTSSAGGMPSIV